MTRFVRRWSPNGLLIVDLVPELKHVIGEQPPVPELPPQEAQRRFQMVFRRFIGVFARPEHPLALFLDDMQWLDAATLDLLEDLLTRNDLQHLLLIGAYRDNEVNATHPLVRKLEAIRQAGAAVQDIVLTPLSRDDLGQLLADSLHCELERAAPLAELIHEKTTGNPFFAIQFISTLADERLLTFDYGARRWVWDLLRIRAKGFTDNVVELMVGKLNRLPAETQKALQQFACMGNSAEFEMLRMGYPGSVEEHARPSLGSRAIGPHLPCGRFVPIPARPRAGSRVLADPEGAARRGSPAHRNAPRRAHARCKTRRGHIRDRQSTQPRLASHHLGRGSRARRRTESDRRPAREIIDSIRLPHSSISEPAALFLTEETWQRNYQLIFSIEYLMAECELLTAEMVAAEDRMLRLSQRARNRHDFCVVTRLRLTLYTNWDNSDRALDVFLEWLRRDGTDWARHPTREDAMREYARIWTLLGSRQIEDLVELP